MTDAGEGLPWRKRRCYQEESPALENYLSFACAGTETSAAVEI